MNDIQSEKQIIKNAQGGDSKALESLVKLYLKRVYSQAFSYVHDRDEAEDITQEVFVKVWRFLPKFDAEKNFYTWIFEITKNTALDFLKKRKTTAFSEFVDEHGDNLFLDRLIASEPLPQDSLVKQQELAIIRSAVQKLSPSYQEVIKLHSHEGRTFREIADLSGKSLNTVKSQYRRALNCLRQLLGG